MAKYVNADEVAAKIRSHKEINSEFHAKMVEEAQEADVAPVVRCKDCVCFNKPRLGWCSFHMDRENADDFCSYGERKVNNG